jgi:hypothetical protein
MTSMLLIVVLVAVAGLFVLGGLGLVLWGVLRSKDKALEATGASTAPAMGKKDPPPKYIVDLKAPAAPARPKKRDILDEPDVDPFADLNEEEDDLTRFPARLEALETQLLESYRAAQTQLQHLSVKQAELAAKPGRGELAQRYSADLDALERRAGATRRVMGTVWKTRAILLTRVQLATVARRRPMLDPLPDVTDVAPEALAAAARDTARSAGLVREFLAVLDRATKELPRVVPAPPGSAEISDADRAAVVASVDEVAGTFRHLRERLDRLADTLDYNADRLRTREVVEGAAIQLELEGGAGQLLEEVSEALGELEVLSSLGDRGLADAAVDGLSRDISKLEQAGLAASAEAEASLEVERLLGQLPRTNLGR